MNRHLTDAEILHSIDGEFKSVHLESCALCLARKASLKSTSDAFAQLYREGLPPALAERKTPFAQRFPAIATIAACIAILFAGAGLSFRSTRAEVPRASLTPGFAREVSRAEVCAAREESEVPEIEPSAAREVFAAYGIRNPKPRSYEIDYLIPPDIGGSADRRNLWPQPYAEGVWNSRVKDALEDRLHTLVCSGNLDIETAQHELASDWVAAYKKYFRTTQPLTDHAAFVKDPAWQ